MGNCLRNFCPRHRTSENDRHSGWHASSYQPQSRHVDNDPILHPAPGLSVPYSQLTEEQQVAIATRMALITTLPIHLFDETEHEKVPECVICMIDYMPGDELRKMPMCTHFFHRACIDDWLTRSLTCPSCLQEIPIPSNVPLATTATTTTPDSEINDTRCNEQGGQSQQQMSQSIRDEEPPQGSSSTAHPLGDDDLD
nr:ring finger protein 11 [Hymenolepis microstoma]